MPGWHAAAKPYLESGRLAMAGIVEEQHPDRAALFMQWKRMDWPVLVDAYNVLGVRVVPLTLAVDEHGIVRAVQPDRRRAAEFLKWFVEASFDAPVEPAVAPGTPGRPPAPPGPDAGGGAWLEYATSLAVWGGTARLDETIEALRRAVELAPESGDAHFRLGVAYRLRYDHRSQSPADFRAAVEHWTEALRLDPNQYIWRRRIQQYGPRPDKPYPFYNWIDEARAEIRARGGSPRSLLVEPGLSERAAPPTAGAPPVGAGTLPSESEDRILRDTQWVVFSSVQVPAWIPPGGTARVYGFLRPRAPAVWNNEVGPVQVRLAPPDGWKVEPRSLELAVPSQTAESDEVRTFEVEVRAPGGQASAEIPGYALYYICEHAAGTCLYRRLDFRIPLKVSSP